MGIEFILWVFELIFWVFELILWVFELIFWVFELIFWVFELILRVFELILRVSCPAILSKLLKRQGFEGALGIPIGLPKGIEVRDLQDFY